MNETSVSFIYRFQNLYYQKTEYESGLSTYYKWFLVSCLAVRVSQEIVVINIYYLINNNLKFNIKFHFVTPSRMSSRVMGNFIYALRETVLSSQTANVGVNRMNSGITILPPCHRPLWRADERAEVKKISSI